MKILFISPLILLLFLSGCAKDDMDEASLDSEAAESVTTRAAGTTDYYWHNNEKIWITLDDSKMYLLALASDKTSTSTIFQNVVLSSKIVPFYESQAISISEKELVWTTITIQDYAAMDSSVTSDVIYQAPCFTTTDGTELGLTHLLYVKLRQPDDVATLKELAALYNVEIIGNNEYMPLWFTLACSNESLGNALEIANKLYESGHFESAQPDLMCDDIQLAAVNDPLYSLQWYLNNTGQTGGTSGIDINFESARNISTGNSSIIVAVVDQGIQLDHPDLNIHSVSYDSETGGSPSVVYDTHGTRCAGFISAKTNNGIASIAPDCKVMSISNTLYSTPDSRQKRADAINFARVNGASVISNSWGSAVKYQIINDAISYALTLGRSGNGCVVVFASGNDYDNVVSYPANCNPDIIAVGSINYNGIKSNFSNYGTDLDVVAPGENVNTTTIGSSYVSGINGTSFACPIVAGVAALILSINPDLTQKEVANIIEQTASKCGGYTYATTAGRPNGTWNVNVGYGMVDAYAAASEASGSGFGIIHFNDTNVTSNRTVSGKIIYSKNINVSNKASLTLKGTEKIELNSNYVINQGSTFILTTQ